MNENKFPRLSTLAREYLAIPGTSVSSERAFSTCGLTLTKQRASLDSRTVDAIVFLNKNLKTVPEICPALSLLAMAPSTVVIKQSQSVRKRKAMHR